MERGNLGRDWQPQRKDVATCLNGIGFAQF